MGERVGTLSRDVFEAGLEAAQGNSVGTANQKKVTEFFFSTVVAGDDNRQRRNSSRECIAKPKAKR